MTSLAPAVTAPEVARTRHRPDIQGLRALAVLLVLVYHAGVPWLRGGYVGVDVFFVVSGFLITGLILREIDRTGRLRLGAFYARRMRRLLPATAVVFATVAALTLLVLPVTRWNTTAQDLLASSLYVENWLLARRSVDYLSQGAAASPVQHFWSLGVEEQFYVVWPLTLVALLAVLHVLRRHRPVSRRAIAVGILVIIVPSVLASVVLTDRSPARAYFVTPTRLWELGVGALLAVVAARLTGLSARVRVALAASGLIGIVLAAVVMDEHTPFPGYAAALPTLATAAVIAAGIGATRAAVPALELPGAQWVGGLSYSLYLWHWPLLVVAAAWFGGRQGQLGWPAGLAVVAFSFVPAWLTFRLVEQPLHHSPALARSTTRSLAVGALCVTIGIASAMAVDRAAPRSGTLEAQLWTIADDIPDTYGDGCQPTSSDARPLSCTYGDADSSTVVALVGDSHAAQWEPALRLLAERDGWQLRTYVKSACLYADVDVADNSTGRPDAACSRWVDAVTQRLVADPPDLVVTSQTGAYRVAGRVQDDRDASLPALAAGLSSTWDTLSTADTTVAVLVDNPLFEFDVPDCVARHLDDLAVCSVDTGTALARSGQPIQAAALDHSAAAVPIDLTDVLCDDTCPAATSTTVHMRDAGHLATTYVRSLAPELQARLEPLLAP
ncbi:acyltransferase family protein [Cellulomonas edaphi]|uniref:Acyltransferase family protein n=1 Tax=Cellulomonas edaphi TaxID=3053468 RepID=A0ABT7S4Z6_9CELL|nr:acyltransferase family protein [Cellulomons edaphi]MDM7830699.1 acyltransferase family protein [Cellulomons edaphi]